MIKPISNPIWEHDCNSCIYHGTYDKYDIYTCNDGVSVNHCWQLISLLARFGNEPHQYYSTHLPHIFSGEILSKPMSAIHKALQATEYQYYVMAQEIMELTYMSERMNDLFFWMSHLDDPNLSQERKDNLQEKINLRIHYLNEMYYVRKGLS